MIVKAKVITNSAQDPDGKGRVLIESPTLWEEQSETDNYVPVMGNIPLNVDDYVFVYLEEFDTMNPLIIGKCRDNNHTSIGENPEGYQVIWESVSEPEGEDKVWSVLYVVGDSLIFQNSKNVRLEFTGANFEYKDENCEIKKDEDGNISVISQGTITHQAEGETSTQPVLFGDTTKSELEKLSKRVDNIVQAISNMLSAGVPAPMDGGAALKSTMTASWSASSQTLKSGNPNETWKDILNSSVTTAGKPK